MSTRRILGALLAFTIGWDEAAVLIGVYVVVAYLAQACIGGALIQAGLTSRSVGWVTLLWNLGWLLALLIMGWEVGYIPILHHLMPPVIGIALVRRREQPRVRWRESIGPRPAALSHADGASSADPCPPPRPSPL